MKLFLKYAPWILILVAFLLGQLSSYRGDEQYIKDQFEQDRKVLLNVIDYKNLRIQQLNKHSDAIREKMYTDSIRFAGLLQAKDKRITTLQNRINAINFENASVRELDSIRALLYRAR